MMKKNDRIVCALDVGVSKVCMLIARELPDGGLELIGSGHAESRGINKGVVVNMDEAAAAIGKAAKEAEKNAGISVESVKLGVGGDHFQSCNSRGAIAVTGEHQEVTSEMMSQVIAAARSSLFIPAAREIKHVLLQEFFLDGRGGIVYPVGLSGSQLDVNVHIVTFQSALLQNLINAVNRAEMRVQKVIAQPLASAEAVLSKDEKELGAAMIDIGCGSTSIAVFQQNTVRFTEVLPVGGQNFTRDLAVGIQTPIEEAERIKKDSGTVLTERIAAEDRHMTIPSMGTRQPRSVTMNNVSVILRARAMELLELIDNRLRAATAGTPLITGVVITGGGAMLGGITELAEEVLGMPARLGTPMGIQGLSGELLSPKYAASVGLTQFGVDDYTTTPRQIEKGGLMRKIFSVIKNAAENSKMMY